MVSRSAGCDVYLRYLADVFVCKSGLIESDLAIRTHRGVYRVTYSLRLLMDLFDHKVLIAAFFGCFSVPVYPGQQHFGLVSVQVVELHIPGNDLCHLQVSDVINVSCIFQEGRDVGSKVSRIVGNADDKRAVLSCGIYLSRTVFEHQSQRKGTSDPDHGLGHGVYGIVGVFFVVVVHQLDQHLGIGLAVERIAVPDHLVRQFLIVLDYAIVNADDVGIVFAGAGALKHIADVRMGVDLAGFSVGGPPCVADAAGARESIASVSLVI